jgi:hypothetical protein
MWRVTEWHNEERELDFSSAGLSKCKSRTVHLNDVRFCNAYSLFQWDLPEFRGQVELCECCGCVDCEPGGYITLRALNGHVAAIPVFDEIYGDDDWASQQYLPPYSIRKHGIPIWTVEDYRVFQSEFPTFPNDRDVPALSGAEVFHIIRMEAPSHILGDPYVASPNFGGLDAVLAASSGDHKDWINRLREMYSALSSSPARIVAPSPDDERVVFYLDLPSFPEWTVAWHGDEDGLFLSDTMKLTLPPKENRVAQGNLTPKLPHHRPYGSVSGDSEE